MKNNFNYRLYGRSKGRKKNNKINDIVIKYKIKKIDPLKNNIIDIGAGYGESSLELAKHNIDKNIIVCEKYIDGINNIGKNIQSKSLNNISIFHGNANQLLDEYCASRSISAIWILFPDPWPKKKHFKRRLINTDFLYKIKNILKVGGHIHIASDSKSYISAILQNVYEVRNDFLWINQLKDEWDYNNLTLPKTKYYKKALENGLNPFYLKLIKL